MRKVWLLAGLFLLVGVLACDRTTASTASTTPPTTTTTTVTTTTTTAFSVHFETNGGSRVFDYTQPSELSLLPVTIRYGYVFSGWYEDAGLTHLFDPEEPRADWTFTLYAKWTPIPATVSFEVDGGSPVATLSLFVGDVLSSRFDAPAKTGYAFAGWFTDSTLTTAFDLSTPLSGNLTLYAKWVPAEVRVTVEHWLESLSGTYVKSGEETLFVQTGSPISATPSPLEGFLANPHHPSSELFGIVLGDGSLVLKAYYDRNECTIFLETRADLSLSSITLPFESPVETPADPVRAGFTFLGWYLDEAGTIPYTFSTMPSENIVVYAKWLGAPALLYFDTHGGTPVDLISAPIESPIVPPNPPTKAGFVFSGWYLSDGPSEKFTVWEMPAGNITLHARWLPVDYTITFEENGGSEVADIVNGYQYPVLRPQNPIKAGYVFGGWFSDSGLSAEYSFTTMPLGGITLYAKWTPEAEATTISAVIGCDEGTSVEVRGTVFARMNAGQIGFYIYDATGVLFIQDEIDPATTPIGSRLGFEGILRFWNGVPMLVNVSSVSLIDSGNPLPDPALLTIPAAAAAVPAKSVFSSCLGLRGVVRPEGDGFVLFDLSTAGSIRLDGRIGGNLSLWVNHYVEIDGVFSRFDGGWQIGAYAIAEPAIADSEKAALLADWWKTQMSGRWFYEETPLPFPAADPFGWGTFTYEYNETNRVYVDDAAGVFKTVAVITAFDLPVRANVGTGTCSWTWSLSLRPAPAATIASFLDAPEGEIVDLRAVVTSVTDKGMVLLEDATGSLFFVTAGDFAVGDELTLKVRRNGNSTFVVLKEEDVLEIAVVARLVWKGHAATPLTAAEFAALDPDDPATYGRYVELRGFLDQLPFEQWGEGHGFRLNDDAALSLEILPVTYAGMESLFDMVGLEVMIRGYIGGDENGNLALYYEGLRQDLRIPDYTDQERVDMIGLLFARENAGKTFLSFEAFTFYPYHPQLGATIAWEFPEGFGDLYDFETRAFGFTAEDVPLKIGFTITQGSVSKTFVYQTTLRHPEYITIADVENHDGYSGFFVKGLVVYRNPDFFFLQDETGLILVEEADVDVYAGDEVVLYVKKQVSAYGTKNISLAKVENDGDFLLVAILSRDNPVEILEATWGLSDILGNDPAFESSFNRHVTVTGQLRESVDFGGYFEVVRGYDRILIAVPDEYTYYKMKTILQGGPLEVRLSGYLYGYDLDEEQWYLLWTGLEPMEYPAYSEAEIAQMVADFLLSEIAGEVPGDQGGFFPPLAHPNLLSTIEYEPYGTSAALFHLDIGFVDAVTVSTEVTVRATVTVGATERIVEFVWTVMPPTPEGEYVPVSLLLDNLPQAPVWIDAWILSAYDGTAGAEILVTDGPAQLWITLPEGTWLYDGAGLVGRGFTGYGSLYRQNGCWKFAATKYEISDSVNFFGSTYEPLTLGEMEAFRLWERWWWIGGAVELEGVLGQTEDGLYVLRDGTDEIVLRGCYYDQDDLRYAIGFPIRIRGFFAGIDTTGGVQRVMMSFTDASPTTGFPYVVTITDPQTIAEMMLDVLDAGIEGKTFEPMEWVAVPESWALFPELFVEYLPVGEVTFDYLNESLFFVIYEDDREGTAQLRITYGSAVATRELHFHLNGYALGTLDDLFVADENLTEFYLPVTVLHSGWGFTYIDYQGSIYCLEGYLNSWTEPGQGVWLYGKRTTIDGEAGFTYDLRIFGIHYDTDVPAAPQAEADDLYAVAEGNLSAYLDVRGILGYDSYLRMFTLTSGGKTVYLRESLPEGGAEVRYVASGSLTREDLRRLVGDEVWIKLFVSDRTLRGDILIADFRGLPEELALVALPPAETLDRVAEKTKALLEGMTFTGGQSILWSLPYGDEDRQVYFEYALAEGFESLPINWTDGGIVGLIAGPTDVDILCTMTYYDQSGETPVEYTDTFVFTIHLVPAPAVTVREALWGAVGETYVVEGVVERHFEDWWIILSDATGRIYVDATGYASSLGVTLLDGDIVRILGRRGLYEYENYVPILEGVLDIDVIGHGAVPVLIPEAMTVDKILALDYLCPDTFNRYVSITGELIFSGNQWYPSYDIREAGMPEDETYDIQIWGNTYWDFNAVMDPLLGSDLRVEGYLIGFQYIYQAFDWIVLHANHTILVP